MLPFSKQEWALWIHHLLLPTPGQAVPWHPGLLLPHAAKGQFTPPELCSLHWGHRPQGAGGDPLTHCTHDGGIS